MIEILTIKKKIPLFKGDEEANSIELLQFDEVDFEVVRQKDLNQVGEKVMFIHPDYNLSDIDLFKPFTEPNGDPKKSKLGSNNRIRAVKFNFHTGNGIPVFSNGIIFSLSELKKYGYDFTTTSEELGITKYDPEKQNNKVNGLKVNGGLPFPSGLYKTDEPNIFSVNTLVFPYEFTGTVKVDGSSITLWYKDGKSGICSRNLLKSFTKQVFDYKRKPTLFEKIKMLFGKEINLSVYKEVENDDIFVKIGKPYLDILVKYCQDTNQNLALRGELCGMGVNGSGNKNNPHAKLPTQILFFGLDDYSYSSAVRETYDRLLFTLSHLSCISDLKFNTTGFLFKQKFNSKKEIVDLCNECFTANLIEGIVVTNDYGSHCKIMNLEYDAKK